MSRPDLANADVALIRQRQDAGNFSELCNELQGVAAEALEKFDEALCEMMAEVDEKFWGASLEDTLWAIRFEFRRQIRQEALGEDAGTAPAGGEDVVPE